MAYSFLQGEARGASRDRVDIAHAAHARMQIWGLAGLFPCPGKVFSCGWSYIRTARPCLKERFDDAAISNRHSSNTTFGK